MSRIVVVKEDDMQTNKPKSAWWSYESIGPRPSRETQPPPKTADQDTSFRAYCRTMGRASNCTTLDDLRAIGLHFD